MPNNLINKIVKTCNISQERAEELWSQAEEIAKKQYKLGPELKGKDFALVVGILKKSIGNECSKKLNWLQEATIMNIQKLIQEAKKQKEKEKKKVNPKKNKEEELSDEEELKKDAKETEIADKNNEFPEMEHRILKDIHGLIEEAKCGAKKKKKSKIKMKAKK